MVQASIDTGQRNAGSQRQRWKIVELLRLRHALLSASLSEDERHKAGSHDHASHSNSKPSDVPKVRSPAPAASSAHKPRQERVAEDDDTDDRHDQQPARPPEFRPSVGAVIRTNR